jgi:hypothetical protein
MRASSEEEGALFFDVCPSLVENRPFTSRFIHLEKQPITD